MPNLGITTFSAPLRLQPIRTQHSSTQFGNGKPGLLPSDHCRITFSYSMPNLGNSVITHFTLAIVATLLPARAYQPRIYSFPACLCYQPHDFAQFGKPCRNHSCPTYLDHAAPNLRVTTLDRLSRPLLTPARPSPYPNLEAKPQRFCQPRHLQHFLLCFCEPALT